jgi:hypothetical protein
MPPPPRRQGRRRTAPKTNNALNYVLAAVVAAAALAIIGVIVSIYLSAPKVVAKDKATGCSEDGPTKVHLVLVDTTDTLPSISREQLAQQLTTLMRSTGKNELLELRTIDSNSTEGTTHFAKCSPGNGSDETVTTGNPEKSKKRWHAEFADPFNALLPTVLNGMPGDSSPILETLQSVAVQRIAPYRQRGTAVDVLLVSDMRQHSEAFSHYGSDISYGAFKASKAYRNLHTNLEGASLLIAYVQRQAPQIDERVHLQFWMDWAGDNNAVLESVERLQGEN